MAENAMNIVTDLSMAMIAVAFTVCGRCFLTVGAIIFCVFLIIRPTYVILHEMNVQRFNPRGGVKNRVDGVRDATKEFDVLQDSTIPRGGRCGGEFRFQMVRHRRRKRINAVLA